MIKTSRTTERGQTTVFVLLGLGLFLVGGVACAVDMANLWFHRQTAQNAADAACLAGAADVMASALGGATAKQGFVVGTSFDCSTTSLAVPCLYATFNGYNGLSTTPGNDVSVSFPGSDPNVSSTSPPTPPASMVPHPLIRVNIVDNVQTFFMGLLSGSGTQPVRAFAVCGTLLLESPIPIVVLDPLGSGDFSIQGNPAIAIYGGAWRSIQVNSSNAAAANIGGSASLDLSKGGPNLTGSVFGVVGGPSSAPHGFVPGTTGSWLSPASLVSDPFAQTCAPGQSGCPQINGYSAPGIPGAPRIPADQVALGCKSIPCSLNYHDPTHGCADPSGCMLYTAGYYAGGIDVKNNTAVFDPGVYYLVGGLTLESNSTARPSTGTGDGSGGTMFYFSGSSSLSVAANSAKTSLDPYYASSLKCTAASQLPSNLPGTTALQGNILVAPCSGYYGDGLSTADPTGEQRGMLFFQDRSGSGVQATWGGGAQFLLAGNMYLHHCNSAGTGLGCGSPTAYYDASLSLGGSSGAATYVFGNIVVDNLSLGGSSALTMDLPPTAANRILKVALIR